MRYVILLHETPPRYQRGTHWDLMFEQGASLRTWALAEEPRADTLIVAEQLTNHRLEYLDYEGPVSGDRGQVTRWDQGTFDLLSDTAEEFTAVLTGQRMHGRVRLVRGANEVQRWGFSFEPG